MRVELELHPGKELISGRVRDRSGGWREFAGWSELAAEVDRLRLEFSRAAGSDGPLPGSAGQRAGRRDG